VLIKPQLAAPKQAAKAGIELKRCKLFASPMSKNPTERFKLRHRKNAHGDFHRKTTQISWSLNPYFALFNSVQWIGQRTPKADGFSALALALRVLT
jgi:hypothetical protein